MVAGASSKLLISLVSDLTGVHGPAAASRQPAGELVTRHVQQAGAGPHAVIGRARIEFMKQHRLDRRLRRCKAVATISGEPSVARTKKPRASISFE
jgi:hypothetical protein